MALPTNSGAGIISAIPGLVQLFAGTGKEKGSKTSTSSKTANPTAINALTGLINQTGPSADKAVANAIDIMMRQGVPSIGANERGSGIFNYSGTKEAMTQLESTAATKAAELDLRQQNENRSTKMQAAGTLGQLTGTQTDTVGTTSKQEGAVDPLMGALALGGLMIGNRLLKGFGGSNEGSSSSMASSPDFTPVIKTPSVSDIFQNYSFEGMANQIASGLKDATTNGTTGEVRTGGSEDLLGVLGNVATSSILGSVGDFFSGIFGGSDSSSAASGTSSGTSGGTVICTRMHELGYMDDITYMYDRVYGKVVEEENPELLAWYHSWAIPFVANWLHGRTLVSRLVIQAIRPAVWVWSQQMKLAIKMRIAQGVV